MCFALLGDATIYDRGSGRAYQAVRCGQPIDNSAVGLDVDALSVLACAVDELTGEVSRTRLCPDHGEIFCWLSLVRAPVRVV
jgi:hypothetical protein